MKLFQLHAAFFMVLLLCGSIHETIGLQGRVIKGLAGGIAGGVAAIIGPRVIGGKQCSNIFCLRIRNWNC